jgi:hypothetical protein
VVAKEHLRHFSDYFFVTVALPLRSIGYEKEQNVLREILE